MPIEARRAVEFSRSVFRRADDAMNHIRREHSAARDTVRSSRSAAKRSGAPAIYLLEELAAKWWSLSMGGINGYQFFSLAASKLALSFPAY
jgi:hypothetical protein